MWECDVGRGQTVSTAQIFVKQMNDCGFCGGAGSVPPCPATCPQPCQCGNGQVEPACNEDCDCTTTGGVTKCLDKSRNEVDEGCCVNCQFVVSGQPCKINPTTKTTTVCTLCPKTPPGGTLGNCCATSTVPCCLQKDRTCNGMGHCQDSKCTVTQGAC
jgi:hypothetical protein